MSDKYPVLSVETFTHSGYASPGVVRAANEDRVFGHQQSHDFAVIDGATSITGTMINNLTDGAYIAQYMSDYLQGKANQSCEMHEAVLEANGAFGAHLQKDYPQIYALAKQGPAAGGCMMRLHDDGSYSYAQAGDCILLEKKKGQPWQQLTADSRWEDDSKYEILMQAMFKQGASIAEVRADKIICKMIEEHRLKSNVTKPVLTGEQELADHICKGRRSLKDVEMLLLMSDGMAWPEGEKEQGFLAAAEKMQQGFSGYYQELKALYDADDQYQKYPRFKHIDDATALKMMFKA